MKSLKEQVKDLESSRAKDFDPEDDSARRADEDDSEIEDQVNGDAGREHYEPVGKSSLREPESHPLDSKYGGVAVSRRALEEEEEDDPFAPVEEFDEEDPFAARNGETKAGEEPDVSIDKDADVDEDEEIDSDEALGESDVERFKDFTFRGSRKNRIDAQSQDDLSDEENESTGSEEQSTSETDVDMDDEEEESNDGSSISSAATSDSKSSNPASNADRKALRQAAFSTAGLASALSAGANADIKKGQAVKQQRQTFDRLLDARIKLQKGVTAMNDLSDASISEDEVKQAARQAEDAALALWSTIDSIRCTMLSAQDMPTTTDSKTPRKRPFTATRATSLSELWQKTNDLESTINPLRRSTLDKWHTKTQPAIDTAPRSKLLKPTQSSRSRLTDILDAYLGTESSKLTASSTPAPGTFDDGLFYQSLLRDLIASRNANSANATGTSEPFLPTKLHQSGSKNKKVDTTASKGRKVRYTVHEKLENFMAPEHRSTWEDAARREFFASLFGNVGALDEGVGDEQVQSDDEGAEVEALRLFRS
ncbi:rRNA-processing protein bfr2 [Exophiala xenobiotica]|nr:rRNA-processing protein bfr2 [Exophiala xenobiotica]KAK5287453.1 rRNA-processing protein bfr2 [Exophiala xenobiotica]KAK5474783.1 rRNA-processing protein bfr2 [Exophiala xenobiotica]